MLKIRILSRISSPAAKEMWPPIIIGFLESLLYPLVFVIGKLELIALWIGIKTAGGWGRWTEKRRGRIYFQIFLVGSLLSILFGLMAYILIKIFIPNLKDLL
jgi:hypothetical protein